MSKKRFSDESNTHYRFSSADELIEDKEIIQTMIEHHRDNQVPRLNTLKEYYKGDNQSVLVEKRRRDEHLADNRATHNFAKYVSQFIQGYMMGVPLKTSYPDEDIDEKLREINRENDADEHNSELVLDQSIYGRAYELVYRNRDDEVKFTTVDVQQTFVVYDDTVECKPIAAIRYYKKQYEEKTIVRLYTKDKEIIYSIGDEELTLEEENHHYFKGIPVIEYENNKYRQGDFEDVLTLIDLYDAVQSDTANYMQDLNDAMLVIKGNLKIDIDDAQDMKEKNTMMLQTEPNLEGAQQQADAYYIYKKYDVAGSEAYKDRIFNNILLFTSIPNLLDDKASGTQSGEAIKMKLFALSQKRATKERLFKRSLRDRYRIINNIMSVANEGNFDVNDISITFTENLPSMIDKELEWFGAMGGQLSNQTLLEQLSFVENAQEELELIAEESEQKQQGIDMFNFTKEVELDE